MTLLVQYTLIYAAVLTLVALGGMFSERSGVINIGLEGIMVFGAMGGAMTMVLLPATTPPGLIVILTLVVAALVGMVSSLLLAVACINFKADQTLAGTALNMLATATATGAYQSVQHKAQQRLQLLGNTRLHRRKARLYLQNRQTRTQLVYRDCDNSSDCLVGCAV